MSRNKTAKVSGLAADVRRVVDKLYDIGQVEIRPIGPRKGVRRVEVHDRWMPSRLELDVHDERAYRIIVPASKLAAIRRIVCKRLSEEGLPVAA